MSPLRAIAAGGVIVALVAAIWVALASGADDPPPTTTTTTSTSITTTTATTTTTTTVPSTTTAPTTTTSAPDPEARVEEVRLIFQDLWFRWFDAIYRDDEEAVRDVVALPRGLEDFERAVLDMEFPRAPTLDDIVIADLEVLRDTPDCLVGYATLDLTEWRGEGATIPGVDVLWPHDGGWRVATSWVHPGDFWEDDCDSIRDTELP